MKEKLIRYRPGIDPKPESQTDWVRVDAMTDEEVEAAARLDVIWQHTGVGRTKLDPQERRAETQQQE